jgi:hypothetical protein
MLIVETILRKIKKLDIKYKLNGKIDIINIDNNLLKRKIIIRYG